MLTVNEETAYENLANGIIIQAVEDYRKAYSAYLRDPHNKLVYDQCEDLRRFFSSDWCHQLTSADCVLIQKKIEQECKEKRGLKS